MITLSLNDLAFLGSLISGGSIDPEEFGDSFDSYSEESPVTQSLNNGGDIGTWILGVSPFGNGGDDFDSASEGAVGGTLDHGEPGKIGNWVLGAGA